jgi:hypothetical protein
VGGISHLFTLGRKQIPYPKRRVPHCFQNTRRCTKSKPPVIMKLYCQASGVSVTNKTGSGFHNRIYWTSIQLVTAVHISLTHRHFLRPDTLRLLTTPLSCTPLHSVYSTARTSRKTLSFLDKYSCLLVLLFSAFASGCLRSRCLAMGIYVTIINMQFICIFINFVNSGTPLGTDCDPQFEKQRATRRATHTGLQEGIL